MLRFALSISALLAAVFSVTPAPAQMTAGQSYASCFPGVASQKIDLTQAVAGVVDQSNPGNAPLSPINWAAPMGPKVTAAQVGLVFGIAIDASGDAYLANSAAFGLHIVSASGGITNAGGGTLVDGTPGARWMAGQFGAGSVTGGSPDGEPAIWKVDIASNTPTRFGTLTNDGPGFGNIAINPYTDQDFYVSDLSNGKIYHLNGGGAVINPGGFDHGAAFANLADSGIVADTQSATFSVDINAQSEAEAKWGITQSDRLVWGLGVHKRASDADPRLFYAVGRGTNARIFSVSLAANGAIGADITDEAVDLSGNPNFSFISDIAFSADDTMLIAERNGLKGDHTSNIAPNVSTFYNAHQSRVMRYTWSGTAWTRDPALPYQIGDLNDANHSSNNSSGGVDFTFGLGPDNRSDPQLCDQRFVAVGDTLLLTNGSKIYGLQNSPLQSSDPGNLRMVLADSYLTDLDGDTNVLDKSQNGDVEVYRPQCKVAAGLCEITVIEAQCNGLDQNVITVQMTNGSAYLPTGMQVLLSGLSPSDYSVVTTPGNLNSTATITLNNPVAGPVTIQGILTSAVDDNGLSLWCKREIVAEVDPCPTGCIGVSGGWVDAATQVYGFTVTDNANTPGFAPTEVFLSGLPAGAVVSPDPLMMVGGSVSGTITFTPPLPPGTQLSVNFNATGGDLCCTETLLIEVEKVDCEPKILFEKQCDVQRGNPQSYVCKIGIDDANQCGIAHDLYLSDTFSPGGGMATITGLLSGSPPWSFSPPGSFEALGVTLPQSLVFGVEAIKVRDGKNCVTLVDKVTGFEGERCFPIPDTR